MLFHSCTDKDTCPYQNPVNVSLSDDRKNNVNSIQQWLSSFFHFVWSSRVNPVKLAMQSINEAQLCTCDQNLDQSYLEKYDDNLGDIHLNPSQSRGAHDTSLTTSDAALIESCRHRKRYKLTCSNAGSSLTSTLSTPHTQLYYE